MKTMMVLKSSLVLGCAAALAAAGDVPCPSETAFPWCDTKLPRAERVASLVANLSKAEKSTLFTNGASGVDRIHWPKYNWWSEALHGVARDGVGTSFPQIGLVAASYNRTLWHAIGDVTSTEGRGKNNKLQGNIYQGLTFWAPNVNIFRDRACCRVLQRLLCFSRPVSYCRPMAAARFSCAVSYGDVTSRLSLWVA